MKTLAERLKEARSEAGLSQGALGKLAKCGQSTIASIERGRNQGSTFLPRLAELLSVSALWLAEGRGPKRPSASTELAHGAIEVPDVIMSGNPRKPLFSEQPNTSVPLHDLLILTTEDIVERKFEDLPGLIGQRDTIKVAAGQHSPSSFGYEITDNAMAGGAQPLLSGWVAIIDPAEKKLNDDAVLVCGPDEQPMVREYMVDGSRHYVQPTGIKLDPREIDPKHIIGVVVGHYYIRKRKTTTSSRKTTTSST